MSHVATVSIEVTNLDDLQTACERLGLVFARGKDTYNWFGESVGDYPIPEGFTQADLGRCEHAIRLKNSDAHAAFEKHGERAYEVGVVKRRDGKPGYTLMWDFYQGGFGLQEKVGENCAKLKQAYAIAAAARTAKAQGFMVTERAMPNGAVQLICQ